MEVEKDRLLQEDGLVSGAHCSLCFPTQRCSLTHSCTLGVGNPVLQKSLLSLRDKSVREECLLYCAGLQGRVHHRGGPGFTYDGERDTGSVP